MKLQAVPQVLFFGILIGFGVFTTGGCAYKNDAITLAGADENSAPSLAEIRSIAREGFIYGLPIVMNYAVLYEFLVDKNSGQWKAPFNQIHNEHRVFTYKDTTVITPNSDTPYSLLGMDLRAEPLVVTVPAVEEARYYSVQFCDSNTFNYGYIGSRSTGHAAGSYLIVGPGWDGATPSGIKKVFRSSTMFSMAIFRTQLFNSDDMPNVEKIQSGYKVVPLSQYLRRAAPPAPEAITFPVIKNDMIKTHFFEYLNFALQFAPPSPEENDIRSRLARIGIGAGKSFSFKDLSPLHKLEVALGMKEGEAAVEQRAAHIGKNVNGWSVGASFGDREFYRGDWLLRAAAAKAGIYGNSAEEAVYPMTTQDSNGNPLDGSKSNYTITFEPGQLPPVNAFWSITMYDGASKLLIENPIDRYLINSPMLPRMKKNSDGSLTVYIQHASPGKDKESNWLPSPAGPIYLVMRLYWPKTNPPSILPAGEGSWAPPPVIAVASSNS